MNFKDRFQGAFIGLFLGDALGAPFEFRYSLPLNMYTGKLEHPTKLNLMYQGTKYAVPGQVTDDSIFSIVLFRNLFTDKSYNRDNVLKSYLHLCNDGGLTFLGRNTRALFKGVTTIKWYENRFDKLISSGEISQSNGSLMRIMPMIYLFSMPEKYKCEEVLQFAMTDTQLTNPCNVNCEATYVYLICFYNIMYNIKSTIDILKHLLTIVKEENIRNAIIEAMNDAEVRQSRRNVTGKTKGWVCHALYCAIFALLLVSTQNCTFEQTLDSIILKGGDSDTNGAIAGALIGFYFGYSNINTSEKCRSNIHIVLNANWNLGDFAFNEIYHPKNIVPILNSL